MLAAFRFQGTAANSHVSTGLRALPLFTSEGRMLAAAPRRAGDRVRVSVTELVPETGGVGTRTPIDVSDPAFDASPEDVAAGPDGRIAVAWFDLGDGRGSPSLSEIDRGGAVTTTPRPFVKNWKLDDAVAAAEKALTTKRNFDRGRRLFGETTCFACHRFDNEGGAHGPDLSGLGGRFSPRDLLESIIDPNKVISDQYASVDIETTDGKQIHGRIVNHNNDNLMIMPNMLDPSATINVDRRRIETMVESKVSMMPGGLLDTLKEDEVLDLMAYLLSRGDRNHEMFKK